MSDSTVNDRIDRVAIAGGGDIGLLTALSVRRMNPSVEVAVIDDFGQDPPQVGKSTYREIQSILHGTLGIDENRFVPEVRPVWKASVYFRDWCDRPAFHYPFDAETKYPTADTPNAIEHYYRYYDELYASPDHRTKGEEIAARNKSPWYFGADGDLDRYENVAYHLNTERFNSFLREVCRERGVALIDDEITAVDTTGTHIDDVRSDHRRYDADLYVDATGFNRVLRGEQDAAFRDFEFPLDTAFNVRIDRDLSEIIPATVVESGDHGWFWHIDTYDNRDLGYVFASEYVADDAAREEFLDYARRVAPDSAAGSGPVVAEGDVDRYAFTSGYHHRAWIDNCLAIGNAEGFVEPLQSTGLTANATAAVRFSNLLASRGRIGDETARDTYNTWVRNVWESIHDFIGVHYKYSSGETQFWQDVAAREVSPRVERVVETFDRNGFDWSVDLLSNEGDVTPLQVFLAPDFYTVMRDMGATSELYEANEFGVSEEVKDEQDRSYRETRAEVEEHLTTRELYRGVLEL